MAKMFYNLKEAAERLNTSEDEVKQLSQEGKLQQFRDGDRLMFKREQVDNVAGDTAADAERTVVDDDLDDSNIQLAEDSRADLDASKTDAIDLEDTSEQTALPAGDARDDSATATGVSVFDADEIDQADPMAQTQVSESPSAGRGEDEDLSLDTAGSGSGLLDLTRESDDTSLGAVELLEDEGTQSGGTSMRESGAPASSTGIFESAGGVESTPSAYEEPSEPAPTGGYVAQPGDPAADGFTGGVLAGVFCVLVVAVLVVGNAMQGITGQLTEMISSQWLYAVVGLAVGCLIFGLIGWAIGRSRA